MRLRRTLARLAAATAATIGTLAAVEVAVRLLHDPRPAEVLEQRRAFPAFHPLAEGGLFTRDADDDVRYRLTPGFEMDLDGRRYSVNSLGFRGDEPAAPGNRDMTRIVLLGDSYAFGLGVDQERMLARRLETRLRPALGGVEVLNLGVPGYQTGQELALAERVAFDLDPELVILLYFGNDQVEEAFHYDPVFRVLYGDALPLPYPFKGVLARSAAYRWLARIHIHSLRSRGELSPLGDRHWPVTRRRLVRLARVCAAHEATLVVANLPLLWSSATLTDPAWTGHADYDRVGALAEELGVAWVDLRAVLLATRRGPADDFLSRLVVSPDPPKDHHLNAAGTDLLAVAIADAIIGARPAGNPQPLPEGGG